MIDIKVYINSHEVSFTSNINVFDRDAIEFEIISQDNSLFSSRKIELFLEDYEIPYVESENGLSARSQVNNLFRESFGYSSVRVFIDDEPFKELIFNVSTDEEKFENIKDMMSYLLQYNEHILNLCLSRTKYKSKNDGQLDASFESIISLAEKIINTFEAKNNTFRKDLRHTLELIKEDANAQNFYNINPYDVINNLDQLQQGYSPNSLKLFGKVYSLEDIQRENHIDSYDLEENRILLGGLMSIKEVLLDISHEINDKKNRLTYDKEYKKITPYFKSFMIEDLYIHLTTEGMQKRISSLTEHIDNLIHTFQKKLRVNFKGFIRPVLSPFARRSSFYLTTYVLLDDWYSLGNPDIGVDHDLAKIRSLSKIYELYTFYKLIDGLHSDGWEVISSVEDSFFKNFIPSQVGFRKNDSVLNVFYEKKIYGFSQKTQHNDLVALNKNNPRGKYNYYHPDFIIMKQKQENVSYFILDSKYSSSDTLKAYKVLDTLYEKYYSNLAIYNQTDNTLEQKSIKSVNAIHPFGDGKLTKWSSNLPRITPDISTILLSKNGNGLGKIFDMINDPF